MRGVGRAARDSSVAAMPRLTRPEALAQRFARQLCFILAMNAYATPYLLGGPRFQMMAPLVYWEFSTNNNWPLASAMALVMMGTTLGLTAPSNVLIPQRCRA